MSPRFTLIFDQEFRYRQVPGLDPGLLFPALPVGLIGPSSADDLLAIVDTGGYSLFDGRRAKSIGLDLMAGKSLHLTALSGNTACEVTRRDFGNPWLALRVRGRVQ